MVFLLAVVCAFSWIKIGIWRQKRAKFQNFSPFSDRQKMLLLNLDWYSLDAGMQKRFLLKESFIISKLTSVRDNRDSLFVHGFHGKKRNFFRLSRKESVRIRVVRVLNSLIPNSG